MGRTAEYLRERLGRLCTDKEVLDYLVLRGVLDPGEDCTVARAFALLDIAHVLTFGAGLDDDDFVKEADGYHLSAFKRRLIAVAPPEALP